MTPEQIDTLKDQVFDFNRLVTWAARQTYLAIVGWQGDPCGCPLNTYIHDTLTDLTKDPRWVVNVGLSCIAFGLWEEDLHLEVRPPQAKPFFQVIRRVDALPLSDPQGKVKGWQFNRLVQAIAKKQKRKIRRIP